MPLAENKELPAPPRQPHCARRASASSFAAHADFALAENRPALHCKRAHSVLHCSILAGVSDLFPRLSFLDFVAAPQMPAKVQTATATQSQAKLGDDVERPTSSPPTLAMSEIVGNDGFYSQTSTSRPAFCTLTLPVLVGDRTSPSWFRVVLYHRKTRAI